MQEFINYIYDILNNQDIWFTTKNDPTFVEPAYYYDMNEFGVLTNKGKKQVENDVKSYIGDGACDLQEAIELWIQESLAECRLDYKTQLRTKFKTKSVVDNISAYPVFLKESFSKSDINSIVKDITKILVSKIFNKMPITFATTPTVDTKYNNTFISLKYTILDKNANMTDLFNLAFSLNDNELRKYTESNIRIARATAYIDRFKKTDVPFIEVQIFEADEPIETQGEVISSVVQPKTESRVRLHEENSKSSKLIADTLQAANFDAESNQGKIVLRTSKLFTKLSSDGFDVSVEIDNGQTQSTIQIGNTGAEVIITVMNDTDKFTPYVSGNYELTKDVIDMLTKIMNSVSQI